MITVMDAPCGAGKSTWAIKYINSNPQVNFIVITPFLKEVERFKHECPDANFKEPKKEHTKLKSFHRLLSHGENIVSTHSLFSSSTEETRELIAANDYVLILDEVMSVVTELTLKPCDLKLILECQYAHVDSTDHLIWDNSEYTGKFTDIKEFSQKGSVVVVNDTALLWEFPHDIFKCFKKTYVLTYMFMCQIQRYYYDLHKIPYELVGVDKEYTDEPLEGNLVEIYEGKLNAVGDRESALSKSWYQRSHRAVKELLRNNAYNFLHNYHESDSSTSMWTTFKPFRKAMSLNGYSKGFVPCNARSTNEHMHRNTAAYLLNLYMNPVVLAYFRKRGIEVDQDAYATSELIQWLYRSCIRIHKNVYLYIPSSRMRRLLKQKLMNQTH